MAQTRLAAVVRHLRGLAAQGDVEQADAELLRRFRERRDEGAFRALVQRHGRMVLGVCRQVLRHEQDAEDAFQATFLVLARSADSIRVGTALPGWLYGVAHRVASNARRAATRRQAHERRARQVAHPDTQLDLAWKELQAVLADEVQRLPEKYRAPFVLCCLEGKSRAEAAVQLGWKEGTVSGRVDEARKRLRRRLTRRGLALSAALCAGALAAGDARALPAGLVDTAVTAATGGATGSAAAVPASVAALAETVMKAKLVKKAKLALALALTAGVLGAGAGLQLHRASARPETPPAAPAAAEGKEADRPAEGPPADPAETVAFQGRVLGPDGKPVAGASVLLGSRAKAGKTGPAARARSDDDGRFAFEARRAEIGDGTVVVGVAPGHGPDWVKADRAGAGGLTLRLVPDVPVAGRILDLEGRPVAGATVDLNRLLTTPGEDLAPALKAWRQRPEDGMNAMGKALYAPGELGIGGPVRTDAEGRFRLTGLGRERLAVLKVRGDTIEHKTLYVVCRPGADVRALTRPDPEGVMAGMRGRAGSPTVYGPTFDHPVLPTKPVAGVVRDKATGKPLAHARVNGSATGHWWEDYAVAETDAEGRYRLVGMPKAREYRVIAGMGSESVYLPAGQTLADSEGVKPLTLDFELVRGVRVKGRVTDKATGQPVYAAFFYAPLADNKYFRDLPGNDFYRFVALGANTDRDGRFSTLVLPGSGVIRFRAEDDAMKRYTQAIVDPADRAKAYQDRDDGMEAFVSAGGSYEFLYGHHAYRLIDPPQGADTVECNVELERGKTLSGTVVGPDGKPLAGASAAGLAALAGGVVTLKDGAFTAQALDPRRPRTLAFLHKERKLAGTVSLGGDEKDVVVKLGPWGAVSGRVLDEDGNALAGVEAGVSYRDPFVRELAGQQGATARTDRDGRFHIDGVFPGQTFTLTFRSKGKFRVGDDALGKLSVKPGEARDFGDLPTKPFPLE